MDTEEAEYAWLPIYCLKPFEKGDAAKHAGREGQTGEDANLSACVAAAERALTSILELHDKRAEAAADEDEADSAAESDSDGGAHHFSTDIPMRHIFTAGYLISPLQTSESCAVLCSCHTPVCVVLRGSCLCRLGGPSETDRDSSHAQQGARRPRSAGPGPWWPARWPR